MKPDQMQAEILQKVDTERYLKILRIKHRIIHKNRLLV